MPLQTLPDLSAFCQIAVLCGKTPDSMRGARLYLIIALVVTVVFFLVMLRSCRQGNHPQSLDDNPERTTVSTLALPESVAA